MLMHAATEEDLRQWREIYQAYKDRLRPNKKSGEELLAYLKGKYPLKEIEDPEGVVAGNVTENEFSARKLKGAAPVTVAFLVENTGAGKALYEAQDELFRGIPIFVGLELKTAYIHVEGSSALYDELTAFVGLDEQDLENVFCVAQYVQCREKYGM